MATVNCLLPQDKSKRLCRGPRGQEAGGSGLAGQRAMRPAWEGAKVLALGLAQHAPRGPLQAPRQGSQLPRPLGRCVQRPGPGAGWGLGPGVTENGWGHEVFRYRARAEEPRSVAAAQTETSPERAS